MPESFRRAAFAALFVLSGGSGLVYEVVWERSLRLTLGVSTYSIAIVTAAFMGGLAIGYWIGRAPFLARRNPMWVYAFAEIGIGLYALAFPSLLSILDVAYLASGGAYALRVGLAFALLLIPTALMGLTLPVATRAFPRWSAGSGASILLAANTIGGTIGAIGAGWWWIRLYGVSGTAELAMVANFAAAIGALALGFGARTPAPAATEAKVPPATGASVRFAMLAALSVGVQTMALQLLWNRMLICAVENTSSSFALILAAVLLGTALGSMLYPMLRRLSGDRPLAIFAVAELALAAWIVASIPLLNSLYDIARFLSTEVGIRSVFELMAVRFAAALVPVGPAVLLGAILVPALVDVIGRGREAGSAVSSVFSAESIGSVAGAFVGAFALIPIVGLGGGLGALAALAALTAVVSLASGPAGPHTRQLGSLLALGVFAGGVAFWQPLELMRWYDGHSGVRGELVHYDEGVSGTVAVYEVDGRKELLINCIEEVPNHRDALVFFRVLANAPLLLAKQEPQRVLVNAFGGGITLGAVARHPGLDITAVELVPEVLGAAPLFAEENGNVLERDNWRFVHDDGRNFLRVEAGRFDAITADATHPAAGESWPLYTREYYEIAREHLEAGGLFAQWLPLHNLVEADFRTILATFAETFDDALLLFVNRYGVLVGGREAIELQPREIDRRIDATAEVKADLHAMGIRNAGELLRYLTLTKAEMLAAGEGLPRNTDDHARLEFAELERIGIPSTFGRNLALLHDSMNPSVLVDRSGLRSEVFWARRSLMRAQLELGGGTPQALLQALRTVEEAYRMVPTDLDIREVQGRLRTQALGFVANQWRQIVSGPELESLVDLIGYARNNAPRQPVFARALGTALTRLEAFPQAANHLRAAVRMDPSDFDSWSNLVYVHERLGQLPLALGALARVEALQPGNPALAGVRRRLEAKAQPQ